MFFEISQFSQKNTSVGVSFWKRSATLFKWYSNTGVLQWNLWKFKKNPFLNPFLTPPVAASVQFYFQSSFSQRHIFGKDEQTNKQKTGKISSATLLTWANLRI